MNSFARVAFLLMLPTVTMLCACGKESAPAAAVTKAATAVTETVKQVVAVTPAVLPVTRQCFSARLTGYATIHANDVAWMHRGDPAVAMKESPFGCSGVRVQYGAVYADYCRGILRVEDEYVRPLLMPGAKRDSPWVGPVHEGGLLSLRARLSFDPGPMPMNMFARAEDARCADIEWMDLEKMLPKDPSTWTKCEAPIALAIEAVRAYQADPGEQQAAAWAKANQKVLRAKYPTSSERLLGLVMNKMYQEVVSPAYFRSDYQSCLATL